MPASQTALPGFIGGGLDGYVVRFDPVGNPEDLAYIGGISLDGAYSVVADEFGNPVITGYTNSSIFIPEFVTPSPLQTALGGGFDAFLVKVTKHRSRIVRNDPYESYGYPIGDGYTSVHLVDGQVNTRLPIDPTQSPDLPSGGGGGGSPSPYVGSAPGNALAPVMGSIDLEYKSGTVDPRPVIEVTVQQRDGDPTPTSIDVTWEWDNVSQGTETFTVPAGIEGPIIVKLEAPVSSTGIHTWQTDVTYTLPDTSVINAGSFVGIAPVVNRNDSPFGPGWGIVGLHELKEETEGVMWIDGGSGMVRFFENGPGGTFLNPDNDFGTLVKNGDGSFTYTAKDQVVYEFDSSGKLTEVIDTHDLKRTFTYNAAGDIHTITSIDGGIATFSYDANDLLTSIAMPVGTLTVDSRDALDNILQITNVDGNARTFEYLAGTSLLSRDPWGPHDVSFTYDSGGRVSSVDRGLGTEMNITPQSTQGLGGTAVAMADNVATVEEDVSATVSRTNTYTLDQLGRLIKQVAPDSTVQTWARDIAGNVVKYTDELGRVSEFTYQYGPGDGDLIKVVRPDGSVVEYTYNSTFHHIATMTDSLDRTTTYTYDATTGDLLTETDPLGQTVTYTYFLTLGVSNGLVETITDKRGFVTSYTYDANRRPTGTIDAEGNQTTFTYDSAGNIETVEDALGRVTTGVYDELRRQTVEIDAFGNSTTYTYNAISQLTSLTDRLDRTATFAYDQRGWLTGMTEAVGTADERLTTYTYDFVGNLLTSTDTLGRVTSYVYDLRDRLLTMTEALGTGADERTTTFVYDDVSNLIQQTDPLGRVSSYVYDVRDRLISMTEALGTGADERDMSWTYDEESNQLTYTDPLGRVTSYVYDDLDRLTSQTDAVGTADQRSMSWGYDPEDNRTTYVDALGRTTSFVYTSRG